MDNRTEVREFPMSRRAKLTPAEAGLSDSGHRRVPGLRRSEVAMLADVSIEYYAKIERGQLGGVSDAVLDAFFPGAVVAFFGNLASGPLANRYGPRVPLVVGMSSLVVGLAVLALSARLGSVALVAVTIALIGGGGSVAMPPLAGVVLEYAPEGQAGVASAVSNTFRQIGGALAVALFGVLVGRDSGFLLGMQLSLGTAAVLAVICLIASRSLRRA